MQKLVTSIYTLVFLFSTFAMADEREIVYEYSYTTQDQHKIFLTIDSNDALTMTKLRGNTIVSDSIYENVIQIEVPYEFSRRLSKNPPPHIVINGTANLAESMYVVTKNEFHILGLFSGNSIMKLKKPDGLVSSFSRMNITSTYTICTYKLKTGSKSTLLYNYKTNEYLSLLDDLIDLNKIKIENNLIYGITKEAIHLDKLFAQHESKNTDVTRVRNINDKAKDKIEKLTQSNIVVKDEAGKDASAWDVIKPHVTILNTADLDALEITERDAQLLKNVYTNLAQTGIGSVKVLGPAGSGKSYFIDLLTSQIIQQKAPGIITEKIFLYLDPASFSSGTLHVGSMEARVNAMIKLSKEHNIVWVIDEIHNLKGKGTHTGNTTNDIWQELKGGLAKGYIRIIGMTTEFEWNEAYAADQPLNERFGLVSLSEPTGEELRKKLKFFIKKNFAKEYEILIQDNVLDLIIRLSSEFNATGGQPRKSTSLIEKLFAIQLINEGQYRAPTLEDVKIAAQEAYNLHVDQFNIEKQRERLALLPKHLDKHIVGQDLAKKAISDSFSKSLAGIEDKSKPKGRRIFAGPKGQGKTELAYAAAQALGLKIKRIVMTSYQHASQIENLKKEIAQALRENAQSVLFFDEIEKAAPEIQKDLIDILDRGVFSVREQRNSSSTISLDMNARNAYVFMATNAGSQYIDSLVNKEDYNPITMRNSMIDDGLNELVMDRMNGIIPFFYLSKEDVRKVVFKEIRKILEATKENNQNLKRVRFENLRGFIDQTVTDTYRNGMSNREILLYLDKLRLKIANAINTGEIGAKDVKIKLEGQRKDYLPKQCSSIFKAI